jgi:hypothetical protein
MSRGAFSSDMVYSMNDLSELKAYAFDRGVEIILGTLSLFCIYYMCGVFILSSLLKSFSSSSSLSYITIIIYNIHHIK